MLITFDEAKRQWTLEHRGLDFARAPEVFETAVQQSDDQRRDYGETRTVTIGYIEGRMMVLVWTARNGARHIISLRKANDREQRPFNAGPPRP